MCDPPQVYVQKRIFLFPVLDNTQQRSHSGTTDNQAQAAKAKDPNSDGFEFDARPIHIQPFSKLSSDAEISQFISDQPKTVGLCVLDGYLPLDHCKRMLNEIIHLDMSGKMQEGKLVGGRTSGVQSEKVTNPFIRSDKIIWIQGDASCPAISSYANDTLNSLVMSLNKHLREVCILEGHTKVTTISIIVSPLTQSNVGLTVLRLEHNSCCRQWPRVIQVVELDIGGT